MTYIIGGLNGGSSTPVAPIPATIALIQAGAGAGSLAPGAVYAVTDWVVTSLPGPNVIYVMALDKYTPSGFVQISTPLGGVGPQDGEFSWIHGQMIRIRDGLANDVSTSIGGTIIGQWPWGSSTVKQNTVIDGSLKVAAGANISNNILQGAVLDFTGSPGPSVIIQESQLIGTSLTAAGGCTLNAVGDNNSNIGAVGHVTIQSSTMIAATFDLEGTGAVSLTNSSLLGNSSIIYDSSSVRNLSILTCDISAASTVSYTRNTSTVATDTISNSVLKHAEIDWQGSADPGFGQFARDLQLSSGATLSMTDPASLAASGITIDGNGTLNVQAGGHISNSRVAAGATLNTGAFGHTSVIIDGAFSVTLTAPNTNTIKNGLGSTVI